MLLHPKSDSYFNATSRLLEIDVCEDKVVTTLDGSLYQETTLTGMNYLQEIEDHVHRCSEKVIRSLLFIRMESVYLEMIC